MFPNLLFSYSSNTLITKVDNTSTKRQIFTIDKNIEESSYKPNSWIGSNSNDIQILDNGIFGAINCYNNNVINLKDDEYKKLINNG